MHAVVFFYTKIPGEISGDFLSLLTNRLKFSAAWEGVAGSERYERRPELGNAAAIIRNVCAVLEPVIAALERAGNGRNGRIRNRQRLSLGHCPQIKGQRQRGRGTNGIIAGIRGIGAIRNPVEVIDVPAGIRILWLPAAGRSGKVSQGVFDYDIACVFLAACIVVANLDPKVNGVSLMEFG